MPEAFRCQIQSEMKIIKRLKCSLWWDCGSDRTIRPEEPDCFNKKVEYAKSPAITSGLRTQYPAERYLCDFFGYLFGGQSAFGFVPARQP